MNKWHSHKETHSHSLHTFAFRLLWRMHFPRYYPPPHYFLPIPHTPAGPALQLINVCECVVVKEWNWVSSGGHSSATCQLVAVPRNEIRKGGTRKEGDSLWMRWYGPIVVADCIRLSLFLECNFYSGDILCAFPSNWLIHTAVGFDLLCGCITPVQLQVLQESLSSDLFSIN